MVREAFGFILPLVMIVVVYAIAFGWNLPHIASREVGDGPLLDGAHGTYSGAVAALVTTATLSGLGQEGLMLGAMFVLGIAMSITNRLNRFKEASFGVLGLVAGAVAFEEVLTGACGDYLPSATARILAIFPVVAMMVSWVVLRKVEKRLSLKDLGWMMLAVPVMIHLGAMAVFPAGLPLLDQQLPLHRAWVPVALIVCLSVIAVGCAIHPRAGADLAAIGLLALTIFFTLYDTPCGISFVAFASVTLVFLVGAAVGRAVRRSLRG